MKKREVFQNSYQAPKSLTFKIRQKFQYVLILLYYIVIEVSHIFQPHYA